MTPEQREKFSEGLREQHHFWAETRDFPQVRKILRIKRLIIKI